MTKKMKYPIVFLLISLIICSCDSKLKREYDGQGRLLREYYHEGGKYAGEYKEYYPSGNIKEVHFYRDGLPRDTSLYFFDDAQENVAVEVISFGKNSNKKVSYYKTGRIKDSGYVDNKGQKFGNWYCYSKEGDLKIKNEYFIIENEEFLNQTVSYDNKQRVLFSKSKIIDVNVFSDTISIKEPLEILACIDIGHFKGIKIKAKVYISSGYGNSINNDFSNLELIELDTVFNLAIDSINGPTFPEFNQERCAAFGKWYDSIGENNIRGVIVEYYKDSTNVRENRFYFEKKVYVKNSE